MNRICQLLNIDVPLIQGGMAWVANAHLAAAVSNAGGIGVIGAGNAEGEWVREQIRLAKSLTNQPFGVNVMLLSPHVDDVIDVICEEKVKLVTTGAGNPGIYMNRLKEVGSVVVPVVPSVALAKRMEKTGADALIVEGTEAGGHIGEVTTMVLVPQIVDAVTIPVIAAGGIADGRGMAAAFALGAEAVQIGTRFLASDECTIHDEYKRLVVKAKDRGTVVTGRFTGHPVRALKSTFTRDLLEREKTGITVEEFETVGAGSLRKAVLEGDAVNGSFMAGQSAGMVKEVSSCQTIITSIMNEYKDVINKMKEGV